MCRAACPGCVRSDRQAQLEAHVFACDFVIANLTPASLDRLLAEQSARLQREARRQQHGWGAFVLNLGVDATRTASTGLPIIIQIVTDMDSPLGEERSICLALTGMGHQPRALPGSGR